MRALIAALMLAVCGHASAASLAYDYELVSSNTGQVVGTGFVHALTPDREDPQNNGDNVLQMTWAPAAFAESGLPFDGDFAFEQARAYYSNDGGATFVQGVLASLHFSGTYFHNPVNDGNLGMPISHASFGAFIEGAIATWNLYMGASDSDGTPLWSYTDGGTLRLVAISAAPEAETWALLLIGLGLVALRRPSKRSRLAPR